MALLLRQLPNILTTVRLLLALPIGILIYRQDYSMVLWLTLVAGLSDGVDGWLARKLNAQSRYGAIVDPLSDKALLTACYIAFTLVALVPWWLGTLVVVRDVLIVVGALSYHAAFGRYLVQPTLWGKASTLFQIVFALLLISEQVFQLYPPAILDSTFALVVIFTIVSGAHYSYVWGGKALRKVERES